MDDAPPLAVVAAAGLAAEFASSPPDPVSRPPVWTSGGVAALVVE